MSSSVVLIASQHATLISRYRQHDDSAVRQRAHMILMLAEGHTWSLISSVLYCSTRTMSRWKRRFEHGGVDALFGRPCGRQTRWSDEAEAVLRQALERSPMNTATGP